MDGCREAGVRGRCVVGDMSMDCCIEVFSGSEIQTDLETDRKWIGNGELSGKNNGSER